MAEKVKKEKGKLAKEFKAFIAKGNVLDMAVGVIVGGAFGKIITSLVNDIIMPPIGLLLGKVNFADLKFVLKEAVLEGETVVSPAVSINYGNFIQLIIDFLLVALCIFIVVKLVAKTHAKADAAKKAEEEKKKAEEAKKKAEEAAKPTVEQQTLAVLNEIKDMLAKK